MPKSKESGLNRVWKLTLTAKAIFEISPFSRCVSLKLEIIGIANQKPFGNPIKNELMVFVTQKSTRVLFAKSKTISTYFKVLVLLKHKQVFWELKIIALTAINLR